ncbi:DUF1513 domain-containing protein [Chelatococcus sambhunathii]|uniref:DUF1513 domain-containing protein n=1 Tax=Chelatococcus sambhunathii TaxID=363953 RepID=UPI002852A0C6|nr:DUF1513 domain-containing protein [Chelatococcus sambhunathii]
MLGGASLASLLPLRARAEPFAGVLGSAADGLGGFRAGALDGGLGEEPGAPLPMRVHALVPRPDGREAVAVGRRPSDVAFVLDGRGAAMLSSFRASPGRRFSGHGAYADRGATFLSAEIDAGTGEGVVVVREVAASYAVSGEHPSAGVGPHEIIPLSRRLAVANGAKEPKTDPGIAALGRTRARSNLALLDAASGAVVHVAEAEASMESLSLRHLVATPESGVIVGAQDTAKGAHDLPLIARLDGGKLRWFDPGYEAAARFGGYIGQLSIDASGRYLAASGPVGGVVGVFDLKSEDLLGLIAAPDCCAVAADGTTGGFVAATGLGEVIRIASHEGGAAAVERRSSRLRWDNHLASLA